MQSKIFCYDSLSIKSASLEFFQFVGKQFEGVTHCLMLAWTCSSAQFLEFELEKFFSCCSICDYKGSPHFDGRTRYPGHDFCIHIDIVDFDGNAVLCFAFIFSNIYFLEVLAKVLNKAIASL